jgi:hypothetical protein
LSYLLIILLAVPCVTFGVSARSKLGAQREFAASLRPLRLVPKGLIRPVAAAITAAEVTVALGLGWAVLAGFGLTPAGPAVAVASLIVAVCLVAVLTSGIAVAIRRGTRAPCACFGATAQPLGRRHLVRNGILMCVLVAGLLTVTVAGIETAEVIGAAVAFAAGAVGALFLIRFDDLVALFAPLESARPAARTRS